MAIRNGEQFSDLGVAQLIQQRSIERKNEVISLIKKVLRRAGDQSGQIIIAGGITDGQKRHAIVYRNKNGLRDRVQIDRGFPYHNGERLVKGTRILVKPK